jgi:hypothetical protein
LPAPARTCRPDHGRQRSSARFGSQHLSVRRSPRTLPVQCGDTFNASARRR